jgi:cysteine desulfurase family protein (TIGR01976 family)
VDIVRANVLTRFNAVLGAMLALILVVGPLQNALFGMDHSRRGSTPQNDRMTGIRSTFDVAALRAQFPALARTQGGRPVVFADAPGGTQVPGRVIDAMATYLRAHNANTGGAFDTSRETDGLIAEARRAAADLLGADPAECVFGQNMTTLSFALSRSLATLVSPGDEVVVTRLDHDANISPWLAAAADTEAMVRWVDLAEADCTLDLGSLHGALSARTKLVAFTLASNAVGSVIAAGDLVRMVRDRSPQAILVADAVHFAQHRAVDVRALGVDVLFCSPYKIFGPHLGIMWGRRSLLESWPAYKVRPQYDRPPDRWETGTLSHEAMAGFVETVGYLVDLGGVDPGVTGRRAAITAGFDAVGQHEGLLTGRFLDGMARMSHVRLWGIADPGRASERTPTFALRVDGQSPRETAERLASRGIFVWDGNYFALAVMDRLGLEASGGAVRIGFCHYNTIEEVDRVLQELEAMGPGTGRNPRDGALGPRAPLPGRQPSRYSRL